MDGQPSLGRGIGRPMPRPMAGAIEPASREGRTYVLVHGAWHGGWCWRLVADELRAAGHRVFTPTQTGLGERRHLLSREITLDTFVDDVVNLIAMEDLQDIVLVGHSFAGATICGVADRVPDGIAHLVFLDGSVLENGQSPFSRLPPDVVAARRQRVAEQGLGIAIPAPPVTAFGIPEDHPHANWVRRHLTPHPVSTYERPLRLDHPLGNGKACTYIHCTNPSYEALESSRQLARRQSGWGWQELATAHDAMVTAPVDLAHLLIQIGCAERRA